MNTVQDFQLRVGGISHTHNIKTNNSNFGVNEKKA